MSILPSDVINNLQNVIFCYEIKLCNSKELYLTSSDQLVKNESISYLPNSGLSFKEAEFNDSAQNYIILEGIFENNGVEYSFDLTEAKVKIILYNNNIFEHFITYYCNIYTKYDLSFEILLRPETIKYNQTIIKVFSKTCRANFGDDKCKVNKNDYSQKYEVKKFFDKSLELVNIDKENGYYNEGFVTITDNIFSSKIISHIGNLITIEDNIPKNLKCTKNVVITTACDKYFITCCNKFNNAINFRGEPFIPNKNFVNI